MKDFQIPSYQERLSPRKNINILDGNICEDIEPGPCFENLPIDSKLTEQELDTFRNIARQRRRTKHRCFWNQDLLEKIDCGINMFTPIR